MILNMNVVNAMFFKDYNLKQQARRQRELSLLRNDWSQAELPRREH